MVVSNLLLFFPFCQNVPTVLFSTIYMWWINDVCKCFVIFSIKKWSWCYSLWTWANALTCIDQENEAEMTLCNFETESWICRFCFGTTIKTFHLWDQLPHYEKASLCVKAMWRETEAFLLIDPAELQTVSPSGCSRPVYPFDDYSLSWHHIIVRDKKNMLV